MANYAGYGGSVTFPNLTAGVKSWTLDDSVDMLDKTTFASAGNREFMRGLKTWTATCEVVYDSANTAATGDSGTLILYYVAAGTNKTGTALVQSISSTTVVDGLVTQTINFQGTGALT